MPAVPTVLRLLALPWLLALCHCEAPAGQNCTLKAAAQTPLQVEDSLLVIPAGINGQWVHLVVDTGAQRSILSQALVERLGLRRDAHHVSQFTGVGGTTTAADVTVDRFVLGGVHFQPVNRMAVGGFNLHTANGLDADGLLGADVLLAFDLDIDVAAGKLMLYDARLCPFARPPWAETPFEITGIRAQRDQLLLPFQLDGVAGWAFLDTGAQRNLLNASMAAHLGLDEHAMASDPPDRRRGIGPNEAIAHRHRFRLLRVGPAVIPDPVLAILPSDAGPWDALIGQDFLLGRRVWISFRNRQIFVTRPLPQP